MTDKMKNYEVVTSQETKERQADKLGGLLHDEWRLSRQLEDGSYEPRIKVLVKTEEGKEKWVNDDGIPEGTTELKRQDIANTDFQNLDDHWQYENKAAAEVAVNLVYNTVDNNKELNQDFIEEASATVHDKWIERNDWVLHPEWGNPNLAKPYSELSEDEQAKDRDHIIKAIEIYKEDSSLKETTPYVAQDNTNDIKAENVAKNEEGKEIQEIKNSLNS